MIHEDTHRQYITRLLEDKKESLQIKVKELLLDKSTTTDTLVSLIEEMETIDKIRKANNESKRYFKGIGK